MSKLQKAVRILSIISIVFVAMSLVMSLVFALIFSAATTNGAIEEVWEQLSPDEQKVFGNKETLINVIRGLSIACFVALILTTAQLILSSLICKKVADSSKSILGLYIGAIIVGLFCGSLVSVAMGICGCCINNQPKQEVVG